MRGWVIIKATSMKGGEEMEEKRKKTSKKTIVKETRGYKLNYGLKNDGYWSAKVTLPLGWLEHMGLSPNDRDIDIEYSPRTKKITIRKRESKKGVGE